VVLEPLPTAELADAAESPIAMDSRIRPVWGGARLAGPAFTVRVPPGVFPSMKDACEQAPAGSVLVVDGGGELRRALWGDKMSARGEWRARRPGRVRRPRGAAGRPGPR
jgi:regulator of RNase E activity RraA